MTKTIEVFDPAMCCSTGVCGTRVDPALVQFAANLVWLQAQGVEVKRWNLSQEPKAFVDNATVHAALRKDSSCLPLILIQGKIVKERSYPDRHELAAYLGLSNEKETHLPTFGGCCGSSQNRPEKASPSGRFRARAPSVDDSPHRRDKTGKISCCSPAMTQIVVKIPKKGK